MPRLELPAVPGVLTAGQVAATAAGIAAVQHPSGEIPWFSGHTSDAWNHTEAAMALAVGGRRAAAVRAYEWLRHTQRPDGSWPTLTRAGVVEDAAADTNQCAYIAVGVWHHWRLTADEAFLVRMWPAVRRALDYVVSMQTDRGEFAWNRQPDGTRGGYALLTGCASTFHSLRAGLALAGVLDDPQPDWEMSAGRVAHVVAEHPEAFADKSRFAMDWYYPVLGGALSGPAAGDRLRSRWAEFVVDGLGVRCVADQPWVTGAETCELVIALDRLGAADVAHRLFAEMQHLRHPDGSYWTGYQFANRVNWPGDRSTYTAAAVVLAADALAGATPAAGVFRGEDLPMGVDLSRTACGCPDPAPDADRDPDRDGAAARRGSARVAVDAAEHP